MKVLTLTAITFSLFVCACASDADMVRPALQSDGGDLTLVKVDNNDVYVELTGACQTCPSSIVTMQMGIERLLQEEFPQFGRLIRVDA